MLAAAARAEPPSLTAATWREPRRPITLQWDLLDLPVRVFRLALSPLLPPLRVIQHYRLGQRAYDLLTNDARTFFVLPYLDLRSFDGLSGGLSLRHTDLFGHKEHWRLSTRFLGNWDYRVTTGYAQQVPQLGGRPIEVDLDHGVDRNRRYFGLGGDTLEEDERVMRVEWVKAGVSFTWLAPTSLPLRSRVLLLYTHEQLGPGEDPGIPSLRLDDPLVTPPPGFGRTFDLLELGLSFVYDDRDTRGRPNRGWLLELQLAAVHDLDEDRLSAVRGQLSATCFVPMFSRDRTIALSAGLGGATPWGSDDALPLGAYLPLGRDDYLRGYRNRRFLAQLVWWSSAEYSYPIWAKVNQPLTLSSLLFVDVGQAGNDWAELVGAPLRWSVGTGLRAQTWLRVMLQLQLGFSPEGVEYLVSAGGLL